MALKVKSWYQLELKTITEEQSVALKTVTKEQSVALKTVTGSKACNGTQNCYWEQSAALKTFTGNKAWHLENSVALKTVSD